MIELDRRILPRYCQSVDADLSVWANGKYANRSADQADARPVHGFDPALMLFDDLKVASCSLIGIYLPLTCYTILSAGVQGHAQVVL